MVDYKNYNAICDRITARLANSKSQKVRDFSANTSEYSLIRMKDRIATSVGNLVKANAALGQEIYPLDMSMRNYDAQAQSRDFSGAATSGAEGVRGADVIDITLIATIQSMLPVLAVDFGMEKPTDVLSYQSLVAVNDHGEVKSGDGVVAPYKPLNWKAKSSIEAAAVSVDLTASGSLNIAPVAPGTVKVLLADGVVGEDVKGDGVVCFFGKSPISATVDYVNGTITIDGTPNGKVTVTASPDMSADEEGSSTLRLQPQVQKITVTAVQHAIALENNIEAISFLNKQVSGKNFGEIATRQYLDAFVYTLNSEVVAETMKAAKETMKAHNAALTDYTLDLSGYYNDSFTNFAVTKDDRVKTFFSRIENTMLAASNKPFTYVLCGSNGATIIRNLSCFEAAPLRTAMMDGVIGYLSMGSDFRIAVVRHQAVAAEDEAGVANLYFGYRDPDGVAAPVGYFEYLPIVSTKIALNYLNSVQFSQTVFNYSTAKTLIRDYVWQAQVKF